MKAFFVISTHLGGAERSLLDLVKALKQDQMEFVVIAPKDHGPLLDELDKANIPWKVLPLPSWFLSLSRNKLLQFFLKAPLVALYLPIFFLQLDQFIKKNKIGTIHSTGLKYHLFLGFYSLSNKDLKLIIHLRDIVSNSLLKKLFSRISANPKVTWISNSKVTAESISPIESQVIYNGFPALKKKTETTSLKDQLGISQETPLVGIVGAIARWKGQREFIEMANHLINQKHPHHFIIVGSEIYDTSGEKGELDFLKNRVDQLSLSNRIHFLDFQKNIQGVYQSLDILVHASIKPEPFGRVIVEAMREGLPVTAANIGGPLEIIEPNKNGLLHTPGDIESMCRNVVYYSEHPKDTHEIRENARQQSGRFSLTEHVQKMAEILKET